MTIAEMKARKTELGLTNEMIAAASGVPVSTVQKIFGGITKSPRKATIDAIVHVLERGTENVSGYIPPIVDSYDIHGAADRKVLRETPSSYHAGSYKADPGFGSQAFRETPSSYQAGLSGVDSVSGFQAFRETPPSYHKAAAGKEPLHTLEDYYALPDDIRVELIDGVFYDMAAPSYMHQLILLDMYMQFRECITKSGRQCEVLVSPIDVRLDRDDYTIVQPDLAVFCGDYDYRTMKRFEGAPDLAVEVLSDSSRSKDMVLKLYKYQQAGVREYWVIDPKYRTVTVHDFTAEEYVPEQYSFTDEVPIAISGGECVIDFSVINRRFED